MTQVFGRIAVVAAAVLGIAVVTPRTVHAASDTAIATATNITPIGYTIAVAPGTHTINRSGGGSPNWRELALYGAFGSILTVLNSSITALLVF